MTKSQLLEEVQRLRAENDMLHSMVLELAAAFRQLERISTPEKEEK